MELRHEAGRKSIHLLLAVLPVAAWILKPGQPVIVAAALILLALGAFLLDRLRRIPGPVQEATRASVGPLIRASEERSLLGSTWYFVALALAFLIYPRTLALAAMAFLILGDAAAALAGRAFGRTTIRPGKTLEGSVACLLGCLLAAALVRMADPVVHLPVLVTGAVAATAGELLADGDRDNLVMPLLSGGVMLILEGLS